MFWICEENSVDNTEMFLLLLSSAYTDSGPFLLLTPPHHAEDTQEVGRGHSWDSWPQLTEGISHTIQRHAQHIRLGTEEGRGRQSELRHLSSQVTVAGVGALVSWGWLNTCPLMEST